MMETATLPPPDEAARAFFARDQSYDGVFWTAVRTTRIFCRPSCPARKPRRENVEFFATVRAAMDAGYRPCKRCRPLESSGRPPAWVAPLLERMERAPEVRLTARELGAMGIDPARARRWFLANHGVTFAAFARARRLGEALRKMRAGEKLDEVALGSGFESHSGFREAFGQAFGGPPGKKRGEEAIVIRTLESPLGPICAGALDAGLCLLEFADRRMIETQLATLRRRFRAAIVPGQHPHLAVLERELAEYFSGARRDFSVPVAAPGSPFQEAVWAALRRIPYGETLSYVGLARAIGKPGAARAVGRANGTNRVAIVIPCHRVVDADGGLGGYGGGVWRKRRLLDLERGGA